MICIMYLVYMSSLFQNYFFRAINPRSGHSRKWQNIMVVILKKMFYSRARSRGFVTKKLFLIIIQINISVKYFQSRKS